MALGLHGQNGFDADVCTHFMQMTVLPVVIYGLIIMSPKPALVKKLIRTCKKILEQILTLPNTVADFAVHTLSGALMCHTQRTTDFLWVNLSAWKQLCCKLLIRRKLAGKRSDSCSWYIEVRKLLVRNDLPSCWDLLYSPPEKEHWKKWSTSKWTDPSQSISDCLLNQIDPSLKDLCAN